MPAQVNYGPRSETTEHAFFRSVPDLANNTLVLRHQQAFVDKLLYSDADVREYLFVPYTGASREMGFSTGHIEVFRLSDGGSVGHVQPSKEIGEIGLQDIRECLRAHRRSDGEYLIFLEEDYKAKILLAEEQDHSVVYLTVGHTKGFYDLLVSPPDEISPLSGQEPDGSGASGRTLRRSSASSPG